MGISLIIVGGALGYQGYQDLGPPAPDLVPVNMTQQAECTPTSTPSNPQTYESCQLTVAMDNRGGAGSALIRLTAIGRDAADSQLRATCLRSIPNIEHGQFMDVLCAVEPEPEGRVFKGEPGAIEAVAQPGERMTLGLPANAS